jgi:hypothetical protein
VSDHLYCDFLEALAKAVARRQPRVPLSVFETTFLHTYMHLPNGAFHFSPGRRRCIERMWHKYGITINFPHP